MNATAALPAKAKAMVHPALGVVATDLEGVTQVLSRRLTGPVQPIPRGVAHLLESGGKRLRPALMCLVHRVFGGAHPQLAEVAAVAEMIHAATLAHDDVIDEADQRRAAPTLRRVMGNHRAVLVGDYLFARCYGRLSDLGLHPLCAAMAATIGELVEGEIQQLERTGDLSVTVAEYEQLAVLKTGSLFGWSAFCGAWLAGQTAAVCAEARDFARHVGVAFQIADDLLDTQPTSGKDLHLDLLEGKMTLPVVLALEEDPTLAHPLAALMQPDTENPAQHALHMARLSGATSAQTVQAGCLLLAKQHLAKAGALLSGWPGGAAKNALNDFLESLIKRNH